jgi:hypothetical protein
MQSAKNRHVDVSATDLAHPQPQGNSRHAHKIALPSINPASKASTHSPKNVKNKIWAIPAAAGYAREIQRSCDQTNHKNSNARRNISA